MTSTENLGPAYAVREAAARERAAIADNQEMREFFREAGAAIGVAGGLAAMWVAPVVLPPVMLALSFFGATMLGGALAAGAAAKIGDILTQHEVHRLCEGEYLTRPDVPVAKSSDQKVQNG